MRRAIGLAVIAAVLPGCSGAISQVDPLPTIGLSAARAAVAGIAAVCDVVRPILPDTPAANASMDALEEFGRLGESLVQSWEDGSEIPTN